jgi:hypothetical protein
MGLSMMNVAAYEGTDTFKTHNRSFAVIYLKRASGIF